MQSPRPLSPAHFWIPIPVPGTDNEKINVRLWHKIEILVMY